jgi:hypothetical protein
VLGMFQIFSWGLRDDFRVDRILERRGDGGDGLGFGQLCILGAKAGFGDTYV